MLEVLEQAELLVAAHERRLEGFGSTAAAALGHHPHGPPGGHGNGLALEDMLAGGLERDGARRGVHRGLGDEHRPGRRRGLEAGRRVHQVARDHALVRGRQA